MPYLTTPDRTRLFYKDWGSGSPVVLVHGWCINGDSWEYVMNDLAGRGLRCVAYDQRGCGRSDQPWTGHDYDTLAANLASLLDTLDLRGATLVGHSMGGGVITRYLAEHGNDGRVARAVLVGKTTPFPLCTDDNPNGGLDEAFLDAMIEVIHTDRAAYVAALAPAFFGTHTPVSQAMVDWGVALTLQASPRAAVEMLRADAHADQRDELARVPVPVLLVHGDRDASCPLESTAVLTHARLPNSRLTVYENKAHGLYITDAARLSGDVFRFIRDDDDAAAKAA